MTEEELKEKMDVLRFKEQEIHKEMRELQKAYKDNYPLQKGDKCIDALGRICWFARLEFWSDSSCSPSTYIYCAKKDGTPTKVEKYTWLELTKVEE